ncbi:hypothetical protein BGW36DRAFT_71765 [Talaromyces proteolyticus]|uniref:ABM domain-containing protein n=1 Tax=Talaromyces proteolyticus TaxID=1131652 RepID=A0AAD4PSQ9_9EURO|nr:uncharacterized protein BGW36DRAFT_71765 [Talaromyces proteolyticus]KAH8689488.1 hypothetical protein BGW36DRAFT_71765 [Talaromyces proteolyticus]
MAGRRTAVPFRIFSQSFVKPRTLNMPITELVFPAYKQDPESIAGLKERQNQIIQSFTNIDGLSNFHHAEILEEDGISFKPESMKRILILKWTDISSFHAFYPKSAQFGAFVNIVKPFLTGPATPELYEESTPSTFSALMQVIRVKQNDGTEEAWKALGKVVGHSSRFQHAKGVENDSGTFLGLISWGDWEEYERVGKTETFLEGIKELNRNEKAGNIIARLTQASEA